MVEAALNAAAEQIVEYSAYGATMERDGNRSPWAAPQGLYACRGWEEWLAISCEHDAQWVALRQVLGEPPWSTDPSLDTRAGDGRPTTCSTASCGRGRPTATSTRRSRCSWRRGVPAARARDPRLMDLHPQHVARRFNEEVDHPVVGRYTPPRPPFTYRSVERWIRTPSPTMGQHNAEILAELGVDDAGVGPPGGRGRDREPTARRVTRRSGAARAGQRRRGRARGCPAPPVSRGRPTPPAVR